MNSAVYSEDILSSIFQFTDNRSQVHCATVCRMWSDVVIPNIWNTVDNINVLFRLFPTSSSGKIHILAEDNWKRFDKYARHVRTLFLDDDCYKSGNDADLHPIFQEIAYTHSSGNLLPNLVELSMKPGSYTTLYSALFLHNNMQTFRATDIRNAIQPNELLYYIVHKAPNITILELASNTYPINLDNFLDELVMASKRLKSLNSLIMWGFFWPSYESYLKLISALNSFAKLRIVEFWSGVDGTSQNENTFTSDFDNEHMIIEEDIMEIGNRDIDPTISFAFLESVTLRLFGSAFSEMFALDYHFPNIKKLKIILCAEVLEESLHTCFVQLALNWKTLQSFILTVGIKDLNPEYEEVHFASMQPLLDLVNLKCLTIYHPRPLFYSDEDAEMMAKGWPQMLYLKLNPEPQLNDRQPTNLTLSALGSFAAHCKKLKSLALYVDATNSEDLRPIEFRSKTLTSLYFGISPITYTDRDEFNVAMYIYRCCPVWCKVLLLSSERAKKRLEAEYYERLEYCWRMVRILVQFASSAAEWEHEMKGSGCVDH